MAQHVHGHAQQTPAGRGMAALLALALALTLATAGCIPAAGVALPAPTAPATVASGPVVPPAATSATPTLAAPAAPAAVDVAGAQAQPTGPGAPGPIEPGPAEPGPAEPEPSAPAAFSGDRARSYVEVLGAAPRPAGSPQLAAAAAYAQDQLRAWGYTPETQTFPVRSFEDRGSRLSLVSADGSTSPVSAATLQLAAGGDVEGPLVYAGLGRPEDFAAAGVDVRDRVALLRRGMLTFGQKVANAVAAGATAVVVFNTDPGPLAQATLGSPAAVPAVGIPGGEGEDLARRLAAGEALRARVQVDATVRERTATNVLARKPGPDARSVVIGAHLDGISASPGANDNASGSAVTLELARVLAQREYPSGITFVLFDGEELVGHAANSRE